MGHPESVIETCDVRVGFDSRVRLEFHGSKISSNGGLLLFREPDQPSRACYKSNLLFLSSKPNLIQISHGWTLFSTSGRSVTIRFANMMSESPI